MVSGGLNSYGSTTYVCQATKLVANGAVQTFPGFSIISRTSSQNCCTVVIKGFIECLFPYKVLHKI